MQKAIGSNDHGSNNDVERLVIGLDFGTTYSGIAYAFTGKPDSIYTINTWPGAKGKTSPKCPTVISYGKDDEIKWGFELDRSGGDCIEGVKLLLDPGQDRPYFAPILDQEMKLKKIGKTALQITTDYITAIFQHALNVVDSKHLKNYIAMLDKEYVLSVPAVWSDKAKDATLRAARKAGIHPVTLVKEPEAAALYTLHELQTRGLDVGDTFVLCDAGGGTVDLISYEITKTRPLELKELTVCSGGLAGSLILNKRFEEWIKSVLGGSRFEDLREKDVFRRGMKVFDENIKPDFRSCMDEDQFVTFPKAHLPEYPEKDLSGDTFTISGKRLVEIFDPVCDEVERLVRGQVQDVLLKRLQLNHPRVNNIKAILLVGGFGASEYLHERICKAYPEIQVIQPNDAWSAVVRGTVMSLLPSEAKVISNVAAKHYGVRCRDEWAKRRDLGQKKHWDQRLGIFQVETVKWYIHKNEDLLRSRKVEFPFFRTFDPDPSDEELQIEDSLLESVEGIAPIHPKDGISPVNCTLRTDLSAVPKDCFKRKSRKIENGTVKRYWQLDYKLLVTIQSGPMIFSLVCDGIEYGQAKAEY